MEFNLIVVNFPVLMKQSKNMTVLLMNSTIYYQRPKLAVLKNFSDKSTSSTSNLPNPYTKNLSTAP